MSKVVTLGPVGFKPTGAYDNTREYKKLDVVIYQGSSYIAKSDSIGQLPTNTTYWELLVQKGDTGEKGDPGEVTEEQLDEAMARANMVYNALPKVSDEGDSLTLDGTANCPMKMELKGNTEQTTYTGNNLSYFNRISANGITFEGNDIDALNPTHYLYASEGWNMRNDSNLSGKTYTIYSLANGTTGDKSITFQIGKTGDSYAFTHILFENTTYKDDLKVQTVTLGENEVFTFIDVYVSGSTTANVNFKVMIVEGSYTAQTIGDFEPYVGGYPSPSPDFPQDVRVVTGNNTIKVFGKNLYNRENGQYNVPIYATDGTSASYQDVHVVWVKVKPNTDYSFTLLPNSQIYFVRIIECTGDKGFIYRFPNNYQPGSGVANTLTITTPNNCEWLQIGINQYQTSQISQNNWEVMIEENATPSTYEPYQEQNYSVNLGTIELCKIGDYQDYIYKDNGKWYKHSEICKVVLDGSENWAFNYNNNLLVYIFNTPLALLKQYTNIDALTTHYIPSYYGYIVGGNENYAISYGSAAGDRFCIRDIRYCSPKNSETPNGTIEDFKTWLSTHNTIVYYVLATPTNTEITDTTLISQLNAIENAVSHDTQTNIAQENYSEPFIINAECVRSLKDIFELID